MADGNAPIVSNPSALARAKTLELKKAFGLTGPLKRTPKRTAAVDAAAIAFAEKVIGRLKKTLSDPSSAARRREYELQLRQAELELYKLHNPMPKRHETKKAKPVVAKTPDVVVIVPKPEPVLEPKPVVDATEIKRRADEASRKPAETKPKPELKLVPKAKEPTLDEKIAAVQARLCLVHKRSHEHRRLRGELNRLREEKAKLPPSDALVLRVIEVEPRGSTKRKPVTTTKQVVVTDQPKRQKGGRRNNA